jgi:CBS domain-containing protein
MTDNNILTAPPEAPGPEQKPVREQVKDAVDARDAETLVALLDPLARSAALRQLLLLGADDRDILLTLIPVELAYVVDADDRPVGVVYQRGLLTSKRSGKLAEIMVPPVTAGVATTLDDLQDLFDANNFLGLPVVETDGRLVGVVSRSAVHDAALVRSESESMKRQGVVGDELRSIPTWLRSRRRLDWLSANIVLNIIRGNPGSSHRDRSLSADGIRHVGVLGQSGCRCDHAGIVARLGATQGCHAGVAK